ncbi:MAG: YicC/YloC family endoribonuclease [Crocinitomicaceae bacterium]
MLKSMTGFGKATQIIGDKKVNVEIRSLNSKSLDLNTRISHEYKQIEPQIRKLIADELVRGKVDFSLSIEHVGTSSPVKVNSELAKQYHDQLKSLNEAIGNTTNDYLSLLLRMPEIYSTTSSELSEEEMKQAMDVVKNACAEINKFRSKEGDELKQEFSARIDEIDELLKEIPKFEEERITTVKERIKKSLEDLMGSANYDENRFEQELIYYIEKLDIAEEKMRLANHLDYFRQTMQKAASGKKLGFITQEIGREINTLGSKSNHAEMQKRVIQMKDNLEKIKEQVLNTL